ncbi:MAG: hypothetical protein ABI200_04700, partial [Gaiellales bacterium]
MASLLIIAAIAAALLMPGLGVLFAVGPQRLLPSAWLALPVASILSLALLSLGLIAAFQLGGSLRHVLLGLGVVLVVCLVRGALRVRQERWVRERRRITVEPWRPDFASTAVIIATLCAAAAGWVLQSALFSDTLYHLAQALKIAELDPITWSNSAQFQDGSPHPGYVLPTFQALIALPLMRFDPLLVTLLLPTVIVPLGVLAAAGAAHVVAGTRRAGAVGAWAWLAIPLLGAAPAFRPASLAPYGGEFALHVIAPTVLALVIAAIAAPTRSLLVLIAVATVLVGVLHVSYLVHLAIPMLAIMLGWLWTRPGSEDGETRRTAIVLATVLGAS